MIVSPRTCATPCFTRGVPMQPSNKRVPTAAACRFLEGFAMSRVWHTLKLVRYGQQSSKHGRKGVSFVLNGQVRPSARNGERYRANRFPARKCVGGVCRPAGSAAAGSGSLTHVVRRLPPKPTLEIQHASRHYSTVRAFFPSSVGLKTVVCNGFLFLVTFHASCA
jgi:hypothetical protein